MQRSGFSGDAVGAVLNGQWKLKQVIGEGGLAAVYEADGLQGQGRRAVKLLHQHFQSQPSIVDRFYKEAKACFSLRHPHIASVEAYAYAEDGSPYLVMELLEGLSLQELLANKEPMTPAQAAPLAFGILQALSVAHARQIVHRDLKPANLFLIPKADGQYGIKVLDFGIAKVMDVAGGMGTKTRTGAVLGTPGYMSPEQVRNAKGVDARSDLWAVGVVLYQMLTCRHPYGDVESLGLMVAVLKDDPRPISTIDPALATWDQFFARALARDPEQRFQSAEAMGEQLRQHTQGTPARFVPDGLQTVALPQIEIPMASVVSGGSASGFSSGQPNEAPVQHVVAGAAPVHETSSPIPLAGAQRVQSTQISAAKPQGTPTLAENTPHVQVVSARDAAPFKIVWWGALLAALVCLGGGLAFGYLLWGS